MKTAYIFAFAALPIAVFAQNSVVRYYQPNGTYLANTRVSSTGNTSNYATTGSYIGSTRSSAPATVRYYNPNGSSARTATSSSNSNSTRYYAPNGAYLGNARTHGNTTSVYDNKGAMVQRQVADTKGNVRTYNTKGQFTGQARQTNTKQPFNPANTIAKQALSKK